MKRNKMIQAALLSSLMAVSANAYLFEGLFPDTGSSSAGDVTEVIAPPVAQAQTGAGGSAHFDEHGMIVSDSTFRKRTSNGGWTHMGKPQNPYVVLSTRGGGGTTTPPPALGGGSDDGGGIGAYSDSTSSTGYRDADGNEVNADHATGSFDFSDRNGDGSVSAAEDLGFDI